MSWVGDDWEPIFTFLPVMTLNGSIIWFGRCERRVLRYLYRDGHDHLRKPSTIYQYRRAVPDNGEPRHE